MAAEVPMAVAAVSGATAFAAVTLDGEVPPVDGGDAPAPSNEVPHDPQKRTLG